jgi:hypothetical protein
MRPALRRLTLQRGDVTPLVVAVATGVVVVAGSGRDVAVVVVLSLVGLGAAVAALASRTVALVAVVALAFGAAYGASLVGRDNTLDPFSVVVAVLVYLTVESIAHAVGSAGVMVELAARRHEVRMLARVAAVGAASAATVVVVAAAIPLGGTAARSVSVVAAVLATVTIVLVARRRVDTSSP